MKLAILAILPMAFAAIGCRTINHALDSLSDAELAAYLEDGAKIGTSRGIGYALKKYPDKKDQITKDGKIADDTIRNVIVPVFSGAKSADVTRAALDQMIMLLASKLSTSQIDLLVVIAGTVATQVPMPANPADKLSPRTKLGIAAFFTGMAEGIESALGIPGPTPVPPPAPPPAPPPPK